LPHAHFNHTQFGALNTGGTNNSGVNATLNLDASGTPTNLPYDAQGNFVFANRNGFGMISTVRDPRIIQLVARFVF
jgi:hypothetical protein